MFPDLLSQLKAIYMSIDPNSIPNVVNRFGVTLLANSITALSTSLTVADGAKLSVAGGSIQINDEIMVFTSRSGNVLSGLLRGQDGTLAASHDLGAQVTSQIVALNFNSLKSAVLSLDAGKFDSPTIVSPQNNQALIYNSTTGDWENKLVPAFEGATSLADGKRGGVPQPLAGDQAKYLKADGTWAIVDAGGAVDSVNGQTGVVVLTKSDIGLGNVDNTSDLNKPISTATQTALDGKYPTPLGTNVQYVAGDGSILNFPSFADAQSIIMYARNSTGITILKGSAVYINGALGNRPTIALASSSTEVASTKTLGLVKADILNNGEGIVLITGTLTDLNTNAFNAGDKLYLGSTPGSITNVKPVSPLHLVDIGVCIIKNPSTGSIEVSIQNGYELDELHDVLITDIANDQVIQWESASSLWKNKTLSKSSVGLSNVDNTSDLNKPISTLTQTALDAKVDENAAITGAIKTKITYDAKGLVTAGADLSNTDVPAFTGATSIASGSLGGVPTPVAGDQNKQLRGDGTWIEPLNPFYNTLFFGDGSDGDLTIVSGTIQPTTESFYNNVTISGTGKLRTAGFRIFIKGTLDLSNAPTQAIQPIISPGANASGSSGGTSGGARPSGSIGGSGGAGNGAFGTINAAGTVGAGASNLSVANGGAGGRSNAGGSGASGAGGPLRAAPNVTDPLLINRFEINLIRGAIIIIGGAGGAGGASGGGDPTNAGGGGGGGGAGTQVIGLYVNTILTSSSTATNTIDASGGNGGNGGTSPSGINTGGGSGGGGGGGGWIYLAYAFKSGEVITDFISATGGIGGNGGDGIGTGNNGAGANGGSGGRIIVVNVTNQAVTHVLGSIGGANSLQTGGAGGVCTLSL
jgi:hypothetical protein